MCVIGGGRCTYLLINRVATMDDATIVDKCMSNYFNSGLTCVKKAIGSIHHTNEITNIRLPQVVTMEYKTIRFELKNSQNEAIITNR